MKTPETAEPETFKGYEPEAWSVRKDAIYAANGAIMAGLEYAREILARHDLELGRTTRKNKAAAEAVEGDIRSMELALNMLVECAKDNQK